MKRRREQAYTDTVVYEFVCDACGKVGAIKPTPRYPDPPAGWCSFDSYHNSEESHDSHDVCSFACYVAEMRKLVEDYDRYLSSPPTLRADGHTYEFLMALLAAVGSTDV